MELFFMILTGIGAGIIGGMGMGGGTILIPLLNIFFGVSQHTAQAVNLVAFIPMSLVALVIHIKNKLVDYKVALFVAVPACFTAVAGSFVAKNVEGKVLQKYFGAFLILLSLFQIILFFKEMKKAKKKAQV